MKTIKIFEHINKLPITGEPISRELNNKLIDPKIAHIHIREAANLIEVSLQDGPIGEGGRNGCTIESLIEVAKVIIEDFNNKVPCRENALAITKLDEAIHSLAARTRDRKARGVEGTMQK